MAETINNANAAASTLFLGHNGEWWDFCLIMSVVTAAVVATAIGITTLGSIISHKREAAAAEEALQKYKFDTDKQISEATARAKEAELALAKYKQPRSIDSGTVGAILAKAPPAKAQIAYVRECTDCFWLATFLGQALADAHWQVTTVSPIEAFEPSFDVGTHGLYPAPTALRANPWGITIITKDPDSPMGFDSPTGALFAALVKSFGGSPAVGGTVDPKLPDDTIRIVIAPKP